MGKSLTGKMHFALFIIVLTMLTLFSRHALAQSANELIRGQWSLISIPADPGSGGSVRALFSDDLPAEEYGTSSSWVVLSVNSSGSQYETVEIDDTLKANTGYWIIQQIADSVELDLPATLSPLAGDSVTGCPDDKVCASRSLNNSANDLIWNIVGFSAEVETTFGETRFVTDSGVCADGCTPDEAFEGGLVFNVMLKYNPDNPALPYERVTQDTVMQPWEGYWLAVLPGSTPIDWLLPVRTITPVEMEPRDGEDDTPKPVAQFTERDATRLLMQASFGPTLPDIQNVMSKGSAEAWVDEQLALPATLHLPMVLSDFPDEEDNQEARYTTFWNHAINAPDQLRQRTAFSLSHMLVISARSAVVEDHSNLMTNYYDLLVEGAFGNYRDLLEAVTLSPAMGAYLSMLGNDKPDQESGRRADENYAREMMQLFSIGLVGLNIDGTERPGIITYDQADVESLARVLTGWSWDVGKWNTNARYGWKPDRRTMEKPMVAFADHHDTDAKQFLGITIPAGQTAEADLKMALDRIFNHPNVGPFVAKQLIKRLVTSNPSPAYVRRVATVFNNNGRGVRGDLGAVVRAIVLDNEARNLEFSEQVAYGKLRESILRYAHAFRAFGVTEPLEIKRYRIKQLPQLAPLTAPSVFNFFSPMYSPPGTFTNANLVAPEFQLNSESNVNSVNKLLNRLFLKNEFLGTDLTLNLSTEERLLADPEALVNHLDLLLTANTTPATNRQFLIDYIDANRGSIEDDRLLRDVIALVVSSTEFAIQR